MRVSLRKWERWCPNWGQEASTPQAYTATRGVVRPVLLLATACWWPREGMSKCFMKAGRICIEWDSRRE